MVDIQNFFISANAVPQIPAGSYGKLAGLKDYIDAIGRLTYKGIYVVDYYRKNFLYVYDNPLFLCGYSAEEVHDMGFSFYNRVIPDDSLNRLLRINAMGSRFIRKVPSAEVRNYSISYTFKAFHRLTKKQQLLHHQLTPLRVLDNGEVWLALCLVSIPTETDQDRVRIYNHATHQSWHFDFENKIWIKELAIRLTENEISVVKYAVMGLSMKETAEVMQKKFETIKGYRKSLLKKLGTKNMSEAIQYAMLRQLL